ncbi:MAG TPA: zinc ribbon domain-containing protein [Verrucomicrobiota bacterium]|nr:zinc ribbon domain-containing protein [Verrucomicrobiota bacterium]
MSLISCPECKKEISSTAACCPSCGYVLRSQTAEPQFEAFRKRVLTGGLILCLIGLPVGILLRLPYVWGLAILGIIVATAKLAAMRTGQ